MQTSELVKLTVLFINKRYKNCSAEKSAELFYACFLSASILLIAIKCVLYDVNRSVLNFLEKD